MYGFVQMPDGKLVPFNGADAPFSGGDLDIVSGSFNPLHIGHRALYDHIVSANKAFELAVERVNKGSLTPEELIDRLNQFRGYAPVIILKHPRFIHKIGALYPWNITFHVGIDTAGRIIEAQPTVEVQGMRAKFIVYDRKIDGRKWGLEDIPEPRPKNFIRGMPLDETILGISSTEIRAQKEKKP